MRPALLVVDIQKAFFGRSETTTTSLRNAIEYANGAMPLFRAKGLPVVCVLHREDGDGLLPGTPGFEPHEDLQFEPADLRVIKTTGSAFAGGTGLAELLRSRDIDAVVIAGFCAEYCVLSTCRGAEDEGFKAMLLRDSLASEHPERIPVIEAINEGLSFGTLRHILA
jgi:nicotinamidase-related amidase